MKAFSLTLLACLLLIAPERSRAHDGHDHSKDNKSATRPAPDKRMFKQDERAKGEATQLKSLVGRPVHFFGQVVSHNSSGFYMHARTGQKLEVVILDDSVQRPEVGKEISAKGILMPPAPGGSLYRIRLNALEHIPE